MTHADPQSIGSLVIRRATVVTPESSVHLSVLEDHAVVVQDGQIVSITPDQQMQHAECSELNGSEVIDARGRVVCPAFVDAHTHACWAGDRLDEWTLKMGGVAYLELLRRGGGIMSTVRSVRAASREQLAADLETRLHAMARHGTGTAEVKSGYGLTTASELKMLHAINDAAQKWLGTVVPTACIGHAVDPEQTDPVRTVLNETLPAVNAEFPGIAIDAYCEQGAWSLHDCLELFERAMNLGHPVRVHADQFNDLGMVPEAIQRGFRSVDHLEATTPEHLALLGGSDVHGVMLPCSGFHLDNRYGNARSFIDAGGTLTLATNCNPGSAPCLSVPMAMAIGVRACGATPDEVLCATTRNPAELLRLRDRGRLKVGMRADLIMLRYTNSGHLAFEFGANPVELTILNGRRV